MAKAAVTVPVRVMVTVGSDEMGIEDWELFTVLRRKWDLTQEAVAERAGTKQSEVSRWERGRAEGLGEEKLARLWGALLGLVREERARAAEGEVA